MPRQWATGPTGPTGPTGADMAREALAKVPRAPTAERAGQLAVASSQQTEDELRHTLIALKNPPQRGDLTGILSTLAGSGAAIAKAAKDCATAGAWDLVNVVIIIIAVVAVFASLRKYVDAQQKRHPFHEQVVKNVEARIAEAEKAALATGRDSAGSEAGYHELPP